ncbi:outer membrane protein assembly factor BamA [Leeia sp. TBRC 13508]|uniref:Outer membrane protein assembly factor BamA n=1 Tax=Leeia speluncae TaxID=2884804 RepID=A0ABS8D5X0_9NEIS|nr:outer membrane protein assembly factor BamA [Leeia speluncae]MCB6183600.1 outer membrane protein assembly factor BamA [Leeia speluncae]
MIKQKTISLVLAALFSTSVWAAEPFVIKDIRIEGLQRTEPGTIFSYMPVKVGETFDDEKTAQTIKALYGTGFFKDVRLETADNVLIVQVVERPSVGEIKINGAKEFSADQLKKAMKEAGLAEAQIYDKSLVDQAVQELKRQYTNKGKYSADIKTTVSPMERNRVSISFDISEGVVAKIKDITVVGAKDFSEEEVIDQMQLSTGTWMTWLSKNDQYSKQKLEADIESIKSFYQNQGYLEFSVESTQLNVSPNREDVFIALNINEGKKYTVSDIKFAGDLLVPEDELKALLKINSGDLYSRQKIVDTTTAISDRLGKDGYAFANVNAVPVLDKDKQTVSFTFYIDPGRRVYVRRINISGNTKTKDEVIRREMRQVEGAWYDGEKIKRSRERVDLLGYFSDVTVETPAVPGSTDQVDVNMGVTEKPNNNISLSVGYGQGEGLLLGASLTQTNIFGTGKNLTLTLDTSKTYRTYALSFTDPYFTKDGVSLGYQLYYKKNKPDTLDTGKYYSSSVGAGISFGVPITETDTINYGATVDKTTINTDMSSGSPLAIDFINKHGNSLTVLSNTVSWSSDSRDSATSPNQGTYQLASGELAIGKIKYYKAGYQYQHFYPVSRDVTFMVNGEFAMGGGIGGEKLPFFRNYFAGGIGSVRGYQDSSLGPRDSTDAATGGTKRVVFNAEVFFPFPGMKHDRTLRLSAFVDAGNVFDDKIKLGELRYSTGVALSWQSPLGPLKFSVAQPFGTKSGDKKERFQFQMGTTF